MKPTTVERVKFLDGARLADLIGAEHQLDRPATDANVMRNLKNLAVLLGYMKGVKNARDTDGRNTAMETQEIAALRWALRVLTHPQAQAIAVAELYDRDGNRIDSGVNW